MREISSTKYFEYSIRQRASNITIDITQKYWEKYDLGIPVNAYVGKNFVAKGCLVENFGNLAF